MLGQVRTNARCARCGGAFKLTVIGSEMDLLCCSTRPRRYYIDGRGFGIRKLYRGRDGKPFDTYRSAARTLEVIRNEVDKRIFDRTKWAKEELGKQRLSAASLPWLGYLERNRSREYAAHQRHFLAKYVIPILDDPDVREIKGLDVERLHKELDELPISKNTVRSVLTALRSCLSWLYKRDGVDKVPAFPPLSPLPRKTVGWIERGDQMAILAHVRPDVRLLIETMMETGIRPGECVALKVRDLQDGGIKVERAMTRTKMVKSTKTGAMSWKVVSEGLWGRLCAAVRDKLPEAWLFTNAKGTPYLASQVSWLWRQASLKAGIEVPLYVASRHSRVSQLRRELEKRLSEDLRKELSHTSSRTTIRHYVRDERERLK